MQVKNIVRKAVVLGSAAGFVGMTMAGAFAYDLSTYPAKYIVDGKFDGKIVVGEKASTSDVLGSIDIAASLQGSSVSKVAIPGQAGKVSFSGDSYEIGTGSDQLELREYFGDVVESVTADDLAGLKGGRITTSEGTTNYEQFLRFQDQNTLQNMSVNFVKNDGEDNEKMGDYLVVDTDAPFLEWEIQFDEGLESEITDGDTDTAGDLEDMEDRVINIMGTDYNIVSAQVETDHDNFEMTLMGGSLADTLREQETKTYNINGVPYEVTLVFVSDPSSGSTGPQVKFSVNGEVTQSMAAGDTDTLSGGLQIGVRDVLVNPREGVASFYLGAHKLVLTDDDTATTGFTGGDIEVNDEVDESDVLEVSGQVTGSNFEITSIKYQVTMESEEGSGGIAYIPVNKGARELMDEPELLISDELDIKYGGLTKPETKEVRFAPSGDDEYKLTFTNIDGKAYKSVPFVSTDGNFKFGDSDDDLVFVEQAVTSYPVGVDDYFIVSSKSGADADRAVSNVLRYSKYDEDQRTLELEDLAGGQISTVLDTAGNGTIKVGGHTYAVGVSDVATKDSTLKVDFNGDGTINSGETAVITAWGGLSLAVSVNNGTAQGVMTTLVGNGASLNMTGADVVNVTATVMGRNFDTNGDESFAWEITESADELDLDFDQNSYSGPLAGSVDPVDIFSFEEESDNSDTNVGMTDYGILIREDEPDDSSDPNTLILNVPETQVFGQVFVTMGSVEATEGGAGVSERVNPIAVGLAVLDKDAESQSLYGKENLIIVGGPCANTIAAKFMNNPAQCGEGFEEGKAMISTKEMNGKVAILVAGYESTETLGASRVLADYKAWGTKLKGTEVEVVVADLSSLDVKPQQ